MLTPKHNLPHYMKTWLRTNKRGKLTMNQWLELVTQPLVPLLALLILMLVLFAFNPVGTLRVVGLARYGGLLIGVAVVGTGIAVAARGARFLSLPIYGEELYGGEPSGMLRRNITLYTPRGEIIVFENHIGKKPTLVPDEPYTVYYLADGDRRVLISHAPSDHPDAAEWQPEQLTG